VPDEQVERLLAQIDDRLKGQGERQQEALRLQRESFELQRQALQNQLRAIENQQQAIDVQRRLIPRLIGVVIAALVALLGYVLWGILRYYQVR